MAEQNKSGNEQSESSDRYRRTRSEKKNVSKVVTIAILVPLIGTIVAVILACGGGVIWVRLDEREGIERARNLETDFHQKVPIGSSREQVKTWFDTQGIGYHPHQNVKNPSYTATIPDPRAGDILRSKHIRIDVDFDEEERVRSFRIIRGVEAGTF